MQLSHYIEIRGRIRNTEGLRVGGARESTGFGETDNPVLRHPISRQPYLPGSSLKGKIRSLLELKHSPKTQNSGKPCTCAKCNICRLFGSGDPGNRDNPPQPTRLIFRDAPLTQESMDCLAEALPGSFVEVKYETAMDRNKGTVQQGSLRDIERIPAGMDFTLEFNIRVFEEDKPILASLLNLLAEGFEMLEKDYLGGCGTRGSGAVKIYAEGETPMAEHLRAKANDQ